MAYQFSFKTVGGATRVNITSGADIAHLGELDQKMWTVLSCPTSGLEISEQSLKLIDLDGDNQLHVNEVVKTAEWLCSVLVDPAVLLEGKDSLPVSAIKDEAIAQVARQVAGEKEEIVLADLEAVMAAVTIEEQVAEQKDAEAPFAANVMAAYHAKQAEYAAYYEQEKLAKMGLAELDPEAKKPGLTEEKMTEMGKKIADYEAVLAANAAAVQAAADANAAALAAAQAQYVPLQKLLLLSRDFYRLLRNFLTLEDFYDDKDETVATFQAGTLIVDQRACKLCIRVADMAKHDAQAAASGMFLIYCDCVNRKLAQTMKIVAAVTAGEVRNLTVGKNAIFYDQKGQDWDATIVKVMDNPISISQAFWSPYRKFGNWVSELIAKSAAEKESKGFEDMKSKATDSTASVAANAEAKKNGEAPQPQAFDIAKFAGIFAAIGMAVGAIATALVAMGSAYMHLDWKLKALVIVAILLCISGPSMFLAWLKLRRRNLAPLLNANGWAVNADSIVNTRFGATLTEKVKFPVIKKRK